MKFVLLLLATGYVVNVLAVPSLPVHPGGIGGLFKGPNSETIIKGPDGSVITAAAEGGEVETSAQANNVVASQRTVATIEHESSRVIPLAQVTAHSAVAVPQPAAVVETEIVDTPVIEPQHNSDLVGPSGSISTRGSTSVVAGPASTTISGPAVPVPVAVPAVASVSAGPVSSISAGSDVSAVPLTVVTPGGPLLHQEAVSVVTGSSVISSTAAPITVQDNVAVSAGVFPTIHSDGLHGYVSKSALPINLTPVSVVSSTGLPTLQASTVTTAAVDATRNDILAVSPGPTINQVLIEKQANEAHLRQSLIEQQNLQAQAQQILDQQIQNERAQQTALRNAHITAEQNALRAAQINAEYSVNQNAQIAAEENALRNAQIAAEQTVQRNAIKQAAIKNAQIAADEIAQQNAEISAERTALWNAQTSAEQTVQRNAEIAAEQNAARNAEIVAEYEAQRNARIAAAKASATIANEKRLQAQAQHILNQQFRQAEINNRQFRLSHAANIIPPEIAPITTDSKAQNLVLSSTISPYVDTNVALQNAVAGGIPSGPLGTLFVPNQHIASANVAELERSNQVALNHQAALNQQAVLNHQAALNQQAAANAQLTEANAAGVNQAVSVSTQTRPIYSSSYRASSAASSQASASSVSVSAARSGPVEQYPILTKALRSKGIDPATVHLENVDVTGIQEVQASAGITPTWVRLGRELKKEKKE